MTRFYYVRHGVNVWHIQIVKVHLDFLANPDVANELVSALNRI